MTTADATTAATTVTGQGILQHHFWGEYHATLTIVFERPGYAQLAARVLGPPWRAEPLGFSMNPSPVVACFVDEKVLPAVKEVLVHYGADRNKVNSVATSIDFGEPWTIEIPFPFTWLAEAAGQMRLL